MIFINKPVTEFECRKFIKLLLTLENIKLCKCLLSGLNGLLPILNLLKIENIISKHG